MSNNLGLNRIKSIKKRANIVLYSNLQLSMVGVIEQFPRQQDLNGKNNQANRIAIID
jgi:hypothetical protein